MMSALEIKVGILEAELRAVHAELKELKEAQKQLLEFMYQLKGGRGTLFTLLMAASSVGAVITSLAHFFFNK